MRPRWLLEGCGASLLLSLPYFAQLLFPGDLALFHSHRQLGHILCGLLLAMLGIAIVGFGALAYFHFRFAPGPRALVGAVLAAFVVLHAAGAFLVLLEQW